jgi:hypothetical protein
MRNHIIYKEQADLALQLTNDNEDWYLIIKNRESKTTINPDVTHVTKAVIPYMLEGDLKIAIFDNKTRVKITNFFIEKD